MFKREIADAAFALYADNVLREWQTREPGELNYEFARYMQLGAAGMPIRSCYVLIKRAVRV